MVLPNGPSALMELLHERLPGNNCLKELARSFVWWPGIDHGIEECIKECEPCQQGRHNPAPTPLPPWEFTRAPWERLHADFAGPFLGHAFFLVIDAHSKSRSSLWPTQPPPLSSSDLSLQPTDCRRCLLRITDHNLRVQSSCNS